MNNQQSVIKKVLLSVSSIITIIAIIVAITVTIERANSVKASVLNNIKVSTQLAANGIHEFFRERSRVVTSLIANPFVNNWFENYTERGADINSDLAYQQIVQLFQHESASDPMIKSVFYAPAATHEYFDINGRYNDDNYFTSKRPWWAEALKRDRLFITKPEIDANDKSIVTSIKSTIYSDSKKLLGVLGIDILASEVKSKLIDTMKYQNLGYGFLYTQDGQIISFPDENNRIDMSQLPKLALVDEVFNDADGFKALTQTTTNQQETLSEVTWQGEPYIVYVNSVQDDTMELDWRVGFMVPKHIITTPVNNAIISSVFAVLFIVLITAVVIVLTIKKLLTNPLLTIVKAMNDIATGEGNLTKRIQLERNDELGQLSTSFNHFVENIQQIIKKCNHTTTQVLHESKEVSQLAKSFTNNVIEQKGYIEQIATAATEMTQTIHGISDNAQTALEYATTATSESKQGSQLASNATSLMGDLSKDVTTASDVVSELHKNSQSITAMLDVIKSIADQTNLLALNAAIEAARAGEQGRGFAVVADEVRTLASRTQESAGEIEEIIAKLHASASDAVSAMDVGKERTKQGVTIITQVSEKLAQIAQAISLIEQQSTETASTTKEQAMASDEISRQTVSVNELADKTVQQTSDMENKSQLQREITQELEQTISQFKV